MRAITFIVALSLFTVAAYAQEKLPTIKSNVSVIDIQDGAVLKKSFSRLAPEAKPDVYQADLIDGKPHKVSFITDVDSISFTVEEGKNATSLSKEALTFVTPR